LSGHSPNLTRFAEVSKKLQQIEVLKQILQKNLLFWFIGDSSTVEITVWVNFDNIVIIKQDS
jgi:hypothetical protein